MCRRILVAVASLLLLSACKLELPGIGGGNSAAEGALGFEMVEFKRSGGPQCLGTAGVTAENQQCATVTITYPKVLDAGTPEAIDALNQFIQAQLLDYGDPDGQQPTTLDELANMFIGEYMQDPSPIGSWELERHASIAFSAEHLATLNVTESGYTGGAHPFSGERYYVLDSDTGRQLTLADLLLSGYESGLNVQGERAFRQARGIAADANLESEGFWFENSTFAVNNNFGVMGDGLIFVFNPYEVAPYALGPTQFTVHYEDIRSLITPDGPLAAIAK